jgi:hypothetical protein
MYKKLTITLDEALYDALHRTVGRGKISQFIAEALKKRLELSPLELGYQAMAADPQREQEAAEWCNAMGKGLADAAW